MELRLTGTNANSWVSLDDANIILMDVPASSYGGTVVEFKADDIPFILESHRQISTLWRFSGKRMDARQRLAFPRIGFMLETGSPTSTWFADTYPHLDDSWEPLANHIAWDLGQARYSELANDEIPEDIKEAAVILAALHKNGLSLFEDNKGDSTTYGLGPLSGDNINATAVAGAVFQRMARWGAWQGSVSKAGGSRG